jgi:hypothetical protein
MREGVFFGGYIPKAIQESVLTAPASQNFDPQKIPLFLIEGNFCAGYA